MRRPLLIVALCALACASVGCGESPRTGNVELVVTIPGDPTIVRVDYQLAGPGGHEVKGSVVSASPSSTFSTFVSHVPVGRGYAVKVSAKSPDGTLTCEGTASADVLVNATTLVRLTLTCETEGGGHVVISVGVQCPGFEIDSYTVSPLAASVGGTITVAATASDADADGGVQSFMWTASSGVFAMPTAPETTYRCDAPGAIALTAAASNGPCRDSKTVTVSCVGDGGAD